MAKSSQQTVAAGQNVNVSHFREDGFTEGTQNRPIAYNYDALCEITENKEYFVLFLDKTHSIILDKSGFSEGDPEAFASFLEEKNRTSHQNDITT